MFDSPLGRILLGPGQSARENAARFADQPVDWDRMAEIIAGSSYPEDRPLSFELSMRCTQFFNGELPEQPEAEIRKFLLDARERCERVIRLTEQKRSARRL